MSRPSRLSGLHGAHEPRPLGPDRFGWDPGGDHDPRRTLPDSPEHDRAPGHADERYQPARRYRSRTDRKGGAVDVGSSASTARASDVVGWANGGPRRQGPPRAFGPRSASVRERIAKSVRWIVWSRVALQ